MDNRDVRAAWEYHQATKHSLDSIRRSPHFLDWEIMPLPFKIYSGLEPIALPHDFARSERPALAAITGETTDADGSLDLPALARVFYFSAGVLRRRRHAAGEVYFRSQACTGNLHHIDLYLCCGRLPDLEAGVYQFSPHDFALRRLRSGDHRGVVVSAAGGEASVADAPAVILFVSTFWRNAWKYQARTYRHGFWDSGTLLANLLAVAESASLPARVVLGFVDRDLNQLLDLDGEREATLGLVTLGRNAPPPPPPPAIPPLALETMPLSKREVQYPAIRAVHAASSLSSPEEVSGWRKPIGARSSPPPDGTAVPLTPLPAQAWPREPVESVILRRGSTRVFSQQSMSFEALSTILERVSHGVPADFVEPGSVATDVYVIVNAVAGLEPGAYALERQRRALVLLRQGNFRREAGHLDLGQTLAADAAVNIYWLADLRRVLDRLGNRGYRAVQLEAAIGGGRTYLAAFALGLGATGLTFFDDDVTAFFSPHASGKSVMFLMALGVPDRS